jgi:hypothetical protein
MAEGMSWYCKVGSADESELPPGADLPMRLAIQKAYREITGRGADSVLSAWAGPQDAPTILAVFQQNWEQG